ncbi:MAG: hypothetical protein AMXMBFR52_30760 [Burkholderiales bacterium]
MQPGERIVVPPGQLAGRERQGLRCDANGWSDGGQQQHGSRAPEHRGGQPGDSTGRQPVDRRARIARMDEAWILFAEAGGVLALMVFFVWWTMRGRK